MQENHSKSIEKLETQAIDFLRSVYKNSTRPLFLAYSGGKDSEIVMHLCKKAKIEFTPFFNVTTIDPPGTIKYIKSKPEVMIMQPKHPFFWLIEHRGLPSTFQRFCCDKLKERFVAHNIITGVRRDESKRRRERYTSPEECHVYKTGQKGVNYMPILEWKEADVAEYINAENIRCHPNYYNSDGSFNVKYRLGCMCCPLAYDRGRKDFHKWPTMVRLWCKHLAVYRNTRPRLQKSIAHFNDEYENFYHNLYNNSLQQLQEQRKMPSFNPRELLQDEFGVKLPLPASTLASIKSKFGEE